MAVKIINQPLVEPITIEEAKQHLRISGSDEDIIVASMIKQAREFCEDFQNRKYITQTLELVLDSFPRENCIAFKNCSPIQRVESIKYYDNTGEEHLFDESNYIVDIDGFINRIVLRNYKQWPSISLQRVNGVRIRFTAGFGDKEENVPETVKWPMILHMRLLYDDYKPDERSKLEEARNSLLTMNRVIPV
ncbi:head-tail connector protein [Clostridium sp. ZS2-4]|uniref:head-tail connector protein n=1 Tax=Clostridium sp. ZS2-4 TaxID=2987703 RepID=UPI00227A2ABA|nr:head-tail connector protein [Clostridium sp. ZS2-4]MCY6354519.1 head-tail connector protein [Clostridium sp. ZS2-4]